MPAPVSRAGLPFNLVEPTEPATSLLTLSLKSAAPRFRIGRTYTQAFYALIGAFLLLTFLLPLVAVGYGGSRRSPELSGGSILSLALLALALFLRWLVTRRNYLSLEGDRATGRLVIREKGASSVLALANVVAIQLAFGTLEPEEEARIRAPTLYAQYFLVLPGEPQLERKLLFTVPLERGDEDRTRALELGRRLASCLETSMAIQPGARGPDIPRGRRRVPWVGLLFGLLVGLVFFSQLTGSPWPLLVFVLLLAALPAVRLVFVNRVRFRLAFLWLLSLYICSLLGLNHAVDVLADGGPVLPLLGALPLAVGIGALVVFRAGD